MVVLLSLLAPFAAYLPAESLHFSGVLAAVTAGLVHGRRSPHVLSSEVRMLGTAPRSRLHIGRSLEIAVPWIPMFANASPDLAGVVPSPSLAHTQRYATKDRPVIGGFG